MNREHDDTILAAEYVLGLLDGAQLALAERRIASDSGFAAAVEGWRLRFAEFDDTATPRPTGDDLWRRIETGVLSPAAVASRARPGLLSSWWSSLPALRAMSLGAAAAALLLAIGLGFAIREARQQPLMVAVLLNGDRAGAVVHTFADGRVVLLPLTSIAVPSGRALEVWTLPSKERGPVSVGLMQQARTLELQLRDLPNPSPDQLFEITLEPASGSPTGRPTGPILFKGNTAQRL